eukprot:12071006-Heterocapsa_arctica.AAC.1
MYISELHEKITPFVLKDTPAVLSIGEWTMTKGYSFIWPVGKNPYMLRRGAILCQPVPLLDVGKRNTPLRSRHASPAAH